MTTLSDVLLNFVDCVNRTAPESESGSFFAVGTPAMRGNTIDYSQARRIDRQTFDRWTRRLVPKEGDILLAREAPVGPVVRVPAGGHVAAGQRTLHLRANPARIDPQYLYYYLIWGRTQSRIMSLSMGSTVPHLRVADARTFDLDGLRPRTEQRAIAEVLGALDDKIAANRRTLEMANELFRAKFDALPKSADRTLDSIAMLVRDHVSSSDINPNEQYVGLEHFDSKCIWLTKSGVGSDITSGKTRFNEGDALFGRLRPYFHKVAVASFNGICSTDILVVRPKSPELKSLVIGATSSDAAVQAAVMNSNGTKMPRAKWEDIRSLPVPDHTTEQAQAFSTTGAELVSLARALARENQILASTRDELLPLLMSGRITVRAASSHVEEVV